jgi:hydroxyacylglutathione hydrolase
MSQGLYVRQLKLGPMENFVYLVGPAEGPEVTVVDPAWEVDRIFEVVEREGRRISSVVVSHCHDDHTNGVPELLRRADVPVYAQREELAFSPELRALGSAVRPVAPGEELAIGSLRAKLLHTPGHTPGSQCLWAEDALASGDTVFVNACGRCDLQGGDPEAMYRTLSQVLMKLPEQTRLLPGHDYGDVPVSSLARERAKNPYFQFPDLASFLARRMAPRY